MVLKKGKGKGKGKKKKKAPKYDITAEGTAPFGVLAGHLLRTPLGAPVTVLGVKYANTALKLDPVLWAEHANGLQAPLALVPNADPREQGYRLLSEFGHLACDIGDLATVGDPARTKRTAERPVTRPSFHQTYRGKVGTARAATVTDVPCDLCGEQIDRRDFERHQVACARRVQARERIREAKPVVGVKIEGEEGHPRVEVVKVYPGGAFEAAGIVSGGFVTHINGTVTESNDTFKLLVSQHRAGDIIEVRELSRDGREATTRVMIGGAGLTMDELREIVRLAAGEFTDADYEEDGAEGGEDGGGEDATDGAD